jgi:hypothetical protein
VAARIAALADDAWSCVEDANKVLDQIEREFRARGHRFEAKPLAMIRAMSLLEPNTALRF